MLMSARKRQTGFGLIEVLVSLLIVSIGLLGIASLQIMALKNVGSSMERSQAVIQTYSYLDVLRANRETAIIAGLDVPVMTCDPLNIAASKVEQRKWLTQLQDTVGPQACGQVECQPDDQCTITVQWDDSRAEGGSDNAATRDGDDAMKRRHFPALRVSGRQRVGGFSLVELMTAMLLSLLLMAAAVSVLVTNKRTYSSTEGLGHIQENARIAFELMSRDIREAGGNPCDVQDENGQRVGRYDQLVGRFRWRYRYGHFRI